MNTTRPLVVGLTGGIGSGKSTVSEQFRTYAATLIDADELSRALTAPGGAAIAPIADVFGSKIISADGSLDRKAMREMVFTNPAARQQLEGVLHPLIRQAMFAQLAQANPAQFVLWIVPLLAEHRAQHSHCHRILVVDCPVTTQVERVCARGGLTRAAAQAMVDAQCSREARLAVADDIVDNSGDVGALAQPIRRLAGLYHQLNLDLQGAHALQPAA